MPKVDRPLYGDSATGNLGDALAFKAGDRYPRIERKRNLPGFASSGQAEQREKFYVAKQAWHALSEYDKATWRNNAPAGYTGYQAFIKNALSPLPWAIGLLVLGSSIISQGYPPTIPSQVQYQQNFPGTADSIPVIIDGISGSFAFELNELTADLLAVEGYLLSFKSNIIA